MVFRWLTIMPMCIFYFYVLVLSLNPNVSQHYRDYYIDRRTRVSPGLVRASKPLASPSQYSIAEPDLPMLHDGWDNDEGKLISRRPDPMLYFNLDESRTDPRTLELILGDGERAVVKTVIVNGKDLSPGIGSNNSLTLPNLPAGGAIAVEISLLPGESINLHGFEIR